MGNEEWAELLYTDVGQASASGFSNASIHLNLRAYGVWKWYFSLIYIYFEYWRKFSVELMVLATKKKIQF